MVKCFYCLILCKNITIIKNINRIKKSFAISFCHLCILLSRPRQLINPIRSLVTLGLLLSYIKSMMDQVFGES